MSGKLQELARINMTFTKGASLRAAWSGRTLSVLTVRGIDTFELSCNLGSYSKNVELSSSFLPCPRADLAADLTRSTGDPSLDQTQWTLSSKDIKRIEDLVAITSFEWSPPDPEFSRRGVLAVLTSQGSVVFYVRIRGGWDMLLELTKLMNEDTWSEMQGVNVVRDMCSEKQSCYICWGSTFRPNACFFVTAQRNKTILFWEIVYSEETNEMRAKLIKVFDPEIGDIKTVTWISRSQGTFSLVCSALSGIIKMFEGRIDVNNIHIESSQLLWPYNDLMTLNRVTWFPSGDRTILVCTKYRYFLVFLISANNKLLSQYWYNVNDYAITALTKTCNDALYIGTTNCAIFRVNINVKEDEIVVHYVNVDFKDEYPEFTLYDVSASANNAIWATTAIRKPIIRRYKTCIAITLFKFDDFSSVAALLKNPSEKLTNMWDSVELLRLQVMRDKCLPDANFTDVFSDTNLSTYYMKLYLILWRLYDNISLLRKVTAESIFDTLSPQTIKDTLLVRHAVHLIDVLFQLYNANCKQSKPFQKDMFLGCYNYIKFYCQKYRCDVSSYVSSDALAFANAQEEFFYKCAYCEQVLSEYKCASGHPNQFCVVSLQPILEEDYLVCPICGSTAHPKLYVEKPMCTFCDVFMDKPFL